MAGKRGRPSKTAEQADTKQLLIDAAVALIKKYGADSITVEQIRALVSAVGVAMWLTRKEGTQAARQ